MSVSGSCINGDWRLEFPLWVEATFEEMVCGGSGLTVPAMCTELDVALQIAEITEPGPLLWRCLDYEALPRDLYCIKKAEKINLADIERAKESARDASNSVRLLNKVLKGGGLEARPVSRRKRSWQTPRLAQKVFGPSFGDGAGIGDDDDCAEVSGGSDGSIGEGVDEWHEAELLHDTETKRKSQKVESEPKLAARGPRSVVAKQKPRKPRESRMIPWGSRWKLAQIAADGVVAGWGATCGDHHNVCRAVVPRAFASAYARLLCTAPMS